MKKDFTKGSIYKALIKLALPIIASSVLNMTYNLIDIFWVGSLGKGAISSVATAGFYINLGYSILALAFVGGGILVSHSLGSQNNDEAISCGENTIVLSILLGIIYVIFIFIFRRNLISYFSLSVPIQKDALSYLNIAIFSLIFSSINLSSSKIMNSYGNSKLPFYISSLGLILNIILDPIFIFYLELGVKGVAVATIIANLLVSIIFIVYLNKKYMFFRRLNIIQMDYMKKIIKLGLPISIQRIIFTLISIILGKLVSNWGSEGISAQRIALQVESIAFMTFGAFQGAMTAFIGQNYGAKLHNRIKEGYYKGLILTSFISIFTFLLFYFMNTNLIALFVNDKNVIIIGGTYLRIIAFSQVFIAFEQTTIGAFNGIGKTFIPSINSIVLTILRIPLAIYLIKIYGINGIWWSICISSILKGCFISFLYKLNWRNCV